MGKKEIMRDYDASAPIYDARYSGEQSVKIGFIIGRAKPESGSVVLDAGCGTGMLFGKLGCAKQIIGIDSSKSMLREARKKAPESVDLVLADIEALPIGDGCCDIAYSISVIQLIDDPRRGMEELLRVVKGGGRIAASILRKAPRMAELLRAYGGEFEFIDSETMKDAFIVGRKRGGSDSQS